MNFESLMDDFGKEADRKQKIESTPKEVVETYIEGEKLVDFDYLPLLMKVKLKGFRQHLKPFVDKGHFNLKKLGWKVQFGSSKQWAGLCSAAPSSSGSSKNRNVYISIQFTKHDANWSKNMKDTILHELAHAIIFEMFYFRGKSMELSRIDDLHGITKGHGLAFKAVSKAIGSSGSVFYTNANFKETFKDFVYRCPCGNSEYGNSPRFANVCSKCNKMVDIVSNVQ